MKNTKIQKKKRWILGDYVYIMYTFDDLPLC